MPYRIAIGSCSHPSLPQPLWKIIHSRQPASFIWAGDAVYSDRFAGLNWTAVGLHRVHDHDDQSQHNHNAASSSNNDGGVSWRLTFPPPSIHIDATPDIIRGWYDEQWGIEDYRHFVEGWYNNEDSSGTGTQPQLTRPIIFGTIDDHDYGQNNGDITYQYKRESNVAFCDFLYSGVADDRQECSEQDVCEDQHPKDMVSSRTKSRPKKQTDLMYQRALEGKGVYGVQLYDFSRVRDNNDVLWGGGYLVPDEIARIDPDIISDTQIKATSAVDYSTTHSVAIFALDVRSNKTPWPNGKQTQSTTGTENDNHNSAPPSNNFTSSINPPILDFLGQHQWEWFQSALANSHATVNIIVSGLQIHPERFPNDGNVIEEWSKFPEARQMLYDIILNSGVKSPLLVSGDVHMAQIMRKDCIQSSSSETYIMDGSTVNKPSPQKQRPLVEITTSGMTHSWGTSFSSQPRNHRFPLKLYTYFVSPIFMTIAHYVCPWKDIVIQTTDEFNRGADEIMTTTQDEDNPKEVAKGGRTGMQYFLGLNFAEFEFDFDQQQDARVSDGGGVTVRIFGKQANAPPKLEMRWTFDQLSGNADLPGGTATPQDFVTVGQQNSNMKKHEWICVPHRGLASVYHEYAANITMFITFCTLFLLPHGMCVWILILARRKWSQRNVGMRTDEVSKRPN